jgi:hypothetical protein
MWFRVTLSPTYERHARSADLARVVAESPDSWSDLAPRVSDISVDSEPRENPNASSGRAAKFRDILILLLLTSGALIVHGYHPGAEDAEIYLPGIEKTLRPDLFPFNAQFFQSHGHMTLFPNLIAASVRISHLPLDFVALLWQLVAMFLLLFAGWELTGKCFKDRKARWTGVALLAALFTLPVAGTGLYIMDQYVNPRNLTAFTGIVAIIEVLDRKYMRAGVLLALALSIHPLMLAFVVLYSLLLMWMRSRRFDAIGFASMLPLSFLFQSTSPAYHQVAESHTLHYFLRWQWYEVLGALAPLAILWGFSRIARSRQIWSVDLMCRTFILYDTICILAAVLLSASPRFETLARIQPMRSLHLLYIVMILVAGGFAGEYLLKSHPWRWLALFLPLCVGMFYAQRQLFPASAHIEWPGATPRNPWVQAFLWVRNNTPVDAVFALDPAHMKIPGEDSNGFRAISQRSMLADAVKDSGAVTMFPPLAEEWERQVQAQGGWKNFQAQDFSRLRTAYGVTWVIVRQPGVVNMSCPYQNQVAMVCRLNGS